MTRRRQPTRRRGEGQERTRFAPVCARRRCHHVTVSPYSDALPPTGLGDKGAEPCKLLLQFLHNGERSHQLRLAAEGFKLGSQVKGALRTEVADGSFHAMRYLRRAFGISYTNSGMEFG